ATLRAPAAVPALTVGRIVRLSDGRQDVLARRTVAPGFRYREIGDGTNLRVEWRGAAPAGAMLTYEVAVRIAEAAVTVPTVPLAGLAPPPGAGDALAPSRFIQGASPAIARQARSVVGRATRLDEAVWLLYQHVAAFEPPGDAAGPQEGEEGEEGGRGEGARRPLVRGPGRHGVETHAAYVSAPVASVVLIADQSVPAAVTDRILDEARAAAIDCVLLTARFESRYFREAYLERLVAQNLSLIRQANLVLVATADDAGLYALMTLGERDVHLDDS